MADDATYNDAKDYIRDHTGDRFDAKNTFVQEIMRRANNGDADAKSFVKAQNLDGRLY